MAEQMDYKIGHLRIKYLDMANIGFAQQQYTNAEGFINDFVDTIDEKSKSGNEIKTEFDRCVDRRNKQLNKLKEKIQGLGYLEQKDIDTQEREQIEINFIHDKKEICWRIALNNGLFNE